MSAPAPLRLGTRASALALAQSGQAGRALVAGTGREVELVHVRTQGDADRTSPLAQIGGTGVFVTAVRRALLDGEVDAVVHSCKDLPTLPEDGIALACIPAREDPRDALCARDGLTLADLPRGASVGTGSPRRAAQLLHARPDLHVVAIRGNIDTRLGRALGEHADLDAVVLAASGLRRLGRDAAISELLPASTMLPAPAQGALAIEVRSESLEDPGLAWLVEALAREDDPASRAAVTAERSLLRTLEAGCSAPVAAFAEMDGARLQLQALAIRTDGGHAVRAEASAPLDLAHDELTGAASVPARLGAQLAESLLGRGAGAILADARTS
ncbi:hydroxymethylbilane synthase [Brachybacterium phenoliresistens]|uniref:Porphobilinogen deaminase n=1 Tax=Brachybacterium phenoliresistens TaxID=396014 RepID=Z9JQB7_9MICO|nr:hydroxymethylbilane synthase [Brachybacterium phenoliresistens]EWS79976.1 porphobilinogen deaminase [Brachybacterium phenoliresistens]